jgi:hypothetical protein
MWYNPNKEIDIQRARIKFEKLLTDKKVFELKEKRQNRSLSQNSYLHLILSWYALEYGETLEYIKQKVFKIDVNKEIFEYEYVNRLTSEVRTEYRSTADLDTAELTLAIDRFRDFSIKQAGIYLPEPKDLSILQEIEIQINNNKHYL